MTENKNSRDIFIKEFPGLAAEPAPLGLFGLAVAALVLAATDLGFASAAAKSLMVPWVLFFGATAQLIAGYMDFKRNNHFGAIVFTTYAMVWFAVGLTLIITIFYDVPFDLTHYAYGLIGVLGFTLIFTAASTMTNKVLFFDLIFIDMALVTLIAHILVGSSEVIVGICLVVVSLLSFYAGGAVMLNTMAGKTVLPLGSPIWVPRK